MDDFEKNEYVSKKTLWPYSRCVGSPSIQVNSNPLFATGAISYAIPYVPANHEITLFS